MSESKKGFLWHCPKGHEVYATFSVDELRRDLDKGSVRAFCGRCGENYTIPSESYQNLRDYLDGKKG